MLSYFDIIKVFLGLNRSLISKLLIRLEFNRSFIFLKINKECHFIFKIFCIDNFFVIFSLNKKLFLNLFFFFLISNYRSKRHILNLPVNGQRTWSNKKTAKKLNKSLLIFLKNKFINF